MHPPQERGGCAAFEPASCSRAPWRSTRGEFPAARKTSRGCRLAKSYLIYKKKSSPRRGNDFFLVHRAGLEPATPSVGGWCSIQLSYRCALDAPTVYHNRWNFARGAGQKVLDKFRLSAKAPCPCLSLEHADEIVGQLQHFGQQIAAQHHKRDAGDDGKDQR